MESFLIKYKNKVIGVYTDLDQAKLFINSCLSNNLMNGSIDILVYKSNSCLCIDTITIKNDIEKIEIKKEEIKIITPVIKKELDCNDPLFLKLAEDKINLQHKINMLKVQKERIKESREIYENDIKLYTKFKQILINDPIFTIPELFKEKFNLFKKLDEENKLNWDNFTKEYIHSNIYNEHFKLNSYDESYIDIDKKEDFNEEFEIDSETDSNDSN
jgi:hypothetical protein